MKLEFGNENHIQAIRLLGVLEKEKKKKVKGKAVEDSIKYLEQRIKNLLK